MIFPEEYGNGQRPLPSSNSSTTESKSFSSAAPNADVFCSRLFVFGRGHLLRPRFFQLLGLAVAIALWGSIYKLSLYNSHPTPTQRNLVAKLWIGPQVDRAVKPARVSQKLPLNHGMQFLHASHAWSSEIVLGSFLPDAARRGDAKVLASSIASRAPPPQDNQLA